MCGIAGFHVFGDYSFPGVNRFSEQLLLGIQHRGEDATGYGFVCDDGDSRVQKASLKASEFIKYCAPLPAEVRTVLLHTRLATNGSPAFPENNHPTIAGSVISVHNGVIWNDDKLFERVATPRMGSVDSEVVPALANHYGLDAMDAFLSDIDGSFALAIADASKPGELRLVRGYHSPLYVYKTDKLVVWASTYSTIRNAWAAVFGTPPSLKNVEMLDEGVVLAFDSHGEIPQLGMKFEPASAWTSYYTGKAGANKPVACGITDAEDDNYYSRGWMAKCGICDAYCNDDDLTYTESMWICDDCVHYVLDGPVKGIDYGAIADDVLSAETENDDDIDAMVEKAILDAAAQRDGVAIIRDTGGSHVPTVVLTK